MLVGAGAERPRSNRIVEASSVGMGTSEGAGASSVVVLGTDRLVLADELEFPPVSLPK